MDREETAERSVLVVDDDEGNRHVFDADEPRVWIGLAFDCFKLGWLTADDLKDVVHLCGQRNFEGVYEMLLELDCVAGDQITYDTVQGDWVSGLRSNVNMGEK